MPLFIGEGVNGSEYRGYPVDGRISSVFGATDIAWHSAGHTGVDIAAPGGTIIRAPAADEVFHVETNNPTFGSWCILRHEADEYSLYGHMQETPHVDVGEQVEGGDKLGRVDSTGMSTGAHVHWGHSFRNPYHRGLDSGLLDALTKLHAPHEQFGEMSGNRKRLSIGLKLLYGGGDAEPVPRNFNDREGWIVRPGR